MSGSFSLSFQAHHTIRIVLSSALRSGRPICPDTAVQAVLTAFPDCELSRYELASAIIDSAVQAGDIVIETGRH